MTQLHEIFMSLGDRLIDLSLYNLRLNTQPFQLRYLSIIYLTLSNYYFISYDMSSNSNIFLKKKIKKSTFLAGIGGGLSTTPGIILVSQYFDKHRALANGICVSGTAAGSFVFPLLIELLVRDFGFHGTILLLGGCMLHVCVSATLYRPLDDNYAPDEEEIQQREVKEEQVESSLNTYMLVPLISSNFASTNL